MGEADATLLAAAGLDRLGHAKIGVPLDDFLPAPAQGAIGIEVLAGNQCARDRVSSINHEPTCACIAAERSLLEALGGDCRSPVAALATFEGELIDLTAEILTNDGKDVARGSIRFAPGDSEAPAQLGRQLLAQASPALRALFAG